MRAQFPEGDTQLCTHGGTTKTQGTRVREQRTGGRVGDSNCVFIYTYMGALYINAVPEGCEGNESNIATYVYMCLRES